MMKRARQTYRKAPTYLKNLCSPIKTSLRAKKILMMLTSLVIKLCMSYWVKKLRNPTLKPSWMRIVQSYWTNYLLTMVLNHLSLKRQTKSKKVLKIRVVSLKKMVRHYLKSCWKSSSMLRISKRPNSKIASCWIMKTIALKIPSLTATSSLTIC